MQNIVKQHIQNILEKDIVLEKPKDLSLGHFATPIAFSLAKELRKNPMIIAEDLASKFKDTKTKEIFESVTAVKGFLNFKLSTSFLENQISNALKNQEDFAKGASKNEKILLEYVSANPTGPLHIGHARGAVVGDAIQKVGNYLGYDVTTEYYVNDAGSQMQLLTTSLNLAVKEFIFKEAVQYPEQFYRGEYLENIGHLAIEKYGKDIFSDTARSSELTNFAKDEVLKLIVSDLKDLGIEFDGFVSEKSLYTNWDSTKKVLESTGSVYNKDGKDFIKSTLHGDDSDRVVVRDNGIPTYLAGDIIYHKDKYDRGYDKYINIWGADHHGYIKRVKAAIEFLGNDSSKLEILLAQMVALLQDGQPYKMSKRAGNVILMSEIVEQIGADALRFVFLTKKSDSHLEFDINILKKQDSSNPIFYINYAHARINQLFKKAELSPKDVYNETLESLNQDALDLVYESLLLNTILEDAFSKRDMQKITDYLHSLSAMVHKFYNNNKIIDTDNQNKYLKILSMASLSVRTGLNVLGIKAKEVM